MVASGALVLLLGGCAQSPKNVVFVTKTSFGIDVEAAGQTASFAYDRAEGYFAPRYVNTKPAAVYANLETNGAMFDRKIRQSYATGNAALLLSGSKAPEPAAPVRAALFRTAALETAASVPAKPVYSTENPKSMFFGTGTVVGLKLGYGPTSIDNFTLGFKRKEMSVLPQEEHDTVIPSVLANFDSTLDVKTLFGSSLTINQFFATGDAADGLAANNKAIQQAFERKAESALGEYRDHERDQRRYALVTLACLSQLNDTQIAPVWANAKALGLFDQAVTDQLTGPGSDSAKRVLYTQQIGLVNPNSQTHTGLMLGHQAYVCDLRSKP
jgi:hypothetical protein